MDYKNSRSYLDIYEYISNIEIIDTHEHLPSHEKYRDANSDVLSEYLMHYFSCDLISAGLSNDGMEIATNSTEDLLERFKLIESYWNAARHTGYGRSLDKTVQLLYEIDEINLNTIGELNRRFIESRKTGGTYKKVLKDISKIKMSILDCDPDCDKDFFSSVLNVDKFVYPMSIQRFREIEKQADVKILQLEDWLDAVDKIVKTAFSKGVRVFKSALAYSRPIQYDRATKHEAEKDFNEMMDSIYTVWGDEPIQVGRNFQNFMMHFMLRIAAKEGITFQFHTGLQEGNGNMLAHSNPILLSKLIFDYSNVNFDLFHISFPFQDIAGNMAKNFRNVFLDMCWAHIISPSVCVRTLVEWLDSVPYNKISAFGGDYCFLDAVAGHQFLARENVSKALAVKVEDGCFSVTKAKEIGRALFFDNPNRIFNLL